MKPKQSWEFSCPLEDVNIDRILKEAGPDARLVRFTIDGKTYTAIRVAYARAEAEKHADAVGRDVDYGPNNDGINWGGRGAVVFYPGEPPLSRPTW